MDGRPTWTDWDEAGDYGVPNVLSPRDLVFRPDNMDETVPHTQFDSYFYVRIWSTADWFGEIKQIHEPCNYGARGVRAVCVFGSFLNILKALFS